MKQQIPLTVSELDSTQLKVSKAIWNAANILERNGWTQGQARDEHGNMCLLTAVIHSLHNLDLIGEWSIFIGTFSAIERQIGKRPDKWNDESWQTMDNVVAMLRRISVKTAVYGI